MQPICTFIWNKQEGGGRGGDLKFKSDGDVQKPCEVPCLARRRSGFHRGNEGRGTLKSEQSW